LFPKEEARLAFEVVEESFVAGFGLPWIVNVRG